MPVAVLDAANEDDAEAEAVRDLDLPLVAALRSLSSSRQEPIPAMPTRPVLPPERGLRLSRPELLPLSAALPEAAPAAALYAARPDGLSGALPMELSAASAAG